MVDSEFVFEEGTPIGVGNHGDHDYVFEEGEPVTDTGVSDLVFESGTGLGGLQEVLMVMGGVYFENEAQFASNEVLVYSVSNDNWGDLSNLPIELGPGSQAAVLSEGVVYQVAGRAGDDVVRNFYDNQNEYTVATNSWVRVTGYPKETDGVILHDVNGTVYAFGGDSSAVREFNKSTGNWTSLTGGPTNIDRQAQSFLLDGEAYFILEHDTTVPVYDFSSDSWRTASDSPSQGGYNEFDQGPAAATDTDRNKGYIVINGSGDLYSYDKPNDSWVLEESDIFSSSRRQPGGPMVYLSASGKLHMLSARTFITSDLFPGRHYSYDPETGDVEQLAMFNYGGVDLSRYAGCSLE